MDSQSDKRNVIDQYRDLSVETIKADMAAHANKLEIAIENLERDFNMGTIVRTANAFNVAKLHIIGRKQWNKRGAMATDKYLAIVYHPDVASFLAEVQGKTVIAVDNLPGASDLHDTELPPNAVLVFGSEKSGLTAEMVAKSDYMVQIEQFGSTRSVNVGVAAGIVMYEWVRRNVLENKG